MNRPFVLLSLVIVVVAQSAWSEETDKAGKKVSLIVSMSKQRWPVGETPRLELLIKNPTDQAVRIPFLYFGTLKLDDTWYRPSIPIPDLGGDNKQEHAAHSERKHRLPIGKNWITGRGPKGQKWMPLDLKPGDHVVKFKLGRITTNEIRFAVEP